VNIEPFNLQLSTFNKSAIFNFQSIMDILKEIIATFDESDHREFRQYLCRQRPGAENRKDLALLDSIVSEDGKNEKQKGDPRYHANRKRLKQSLLEYFIASHINEGLSDTSEVMGGLAAALRMFDFGRNEAGWHFLHRALEAAEQSARPDAVLQVLRVMTDHLHKQDELTLTELKTMMAATATEVRSYDRIRLALAEMRAELQRAKTSGSALCPVPLAERILRDLGSESDILSKPREMLHLLEIVRTASLAGKDLTEFEKMLSTHYERLTNQMSRSGLYNKEHIRLAYMMAHAGFRLRKFHMSWEPLERMEKLMSKSVALRKANAAKFLSLKGSILSLTGQNSLAIDIHEEYLNRESPSASDRLNMELNLIFFRFNKGEFGKAARALALMNHSRVWYENKVGVEWVMRKELIRAIVQYENEQIEQAIRTAETLRKNYAYVFRREAFSKADAFIRLIIEYFRYPEKVKEEDVKRVAESVISGISADREDTNAMAFYSWLLSKVTKVDFYNLLIYVASDEDSPYGQAFG
jgi:hypothetical protein